MKKLLLSACCLFALHGFSAQKHVSGKRVERLVSLAEEIGLKEDKLSEFRAACEEYQKAEDNLMLLADLHGLNKVKPKTKPINADVTDPTIKAILKQVQKTHNRFETMKRTINKWGPSTNLTARASGASFQDKLNAARAYEKQVKAIQKAARKDGKNLGKLRKDLEKYRDKAETVDFRDLCQGLLDMLPVPDDEINTP